MDFVSTIISPIAESLKKHLEFLVYSTEYVEDMKKKMDQLNATESDVQEKGIESHRKRKWVEDVKVLNEKSNSIEAVGGINVLKRYKVGKQSYGILEEIKDLENRESKIVFTHAQKPLAELGSTSAGPSTSAPIDDTHPSYLLHPYHHLQSFKLCSDARVKGVLFETDGPLFLYGLPTIQVLKLNGLEEMSHVWKCNWNKLSIPQHQPLQYPFQNLTFISLLGCHKIKYLFSPLMVKFLSNLKDVYICRCSDIEEVISNRDDENEESIVSTSSHQNTTFFPCLDTFKLESLNGLKRIDGGDTIHGQVQSSQVIGACWSLCQYPKRISIDDCNELSSVVPWYAVGQMKKLQELQIWRCERMMEVFESESSTNNVDEGSASGAAGTSTTSTLENITTAAVPQLSNLKRVEIYDCDLLQHIFTFSTLESLKQLEKLTIKRCKAIQVIVKEENGTSSKHVVFPCLKSLVLRDLPNLKGFFSGMNDFRWPSLVSVSIKDCPKFTVFTSGQSKTPKLKNIQTSFGTHRLDCDLNFCGTINQYQNTFPTSSDPSVSKGMPYFHNLIELDVSWENDNTSIIPSNVLLQLEKLEKISLQDLTSVDEVFEVVALEGSGINESQTVVKIPNLTEVWLESLDGLNLVQLQDLSIIECKNIEVIVKEEEEKECDGKVNENMLPRLKSLALYGLQSLKGFCLGKEAFSFPALDTLEIKECPAITVFTKGDLSTPYLNVIDTDFGMCGVRGDLNAFIETTQGEGYGDHIPDIDGKILTGVGVEVTDNLDLRPDRRRPSRPPHDGDHHKQGFLPRGKSVLSNTEAKTLFSRTVEPSPWDGDDVELQNIGEEIVMKCVGLPIAIVIIVKSLSGLAKIDDTYPSYLLDTYHHLQHLELRFDARVKGVLFETDSPLYLYGLPTIQVLQLHQLGISHVWKCNWNKFAIPQHLPFQNLTFISLSQCPKIKYLFSPLMVKFLSNLKDICILYCSDIEEVVSNRDDENIAFHQNTTFYPCLDALKLGFLYGLKRIDGDDNIHGQFQSAHLIGACWSLCQYPRRISINNCYELSSVVPWYAVGQMKKLQELQISSCHRMMEVFESESSTSTVDEGSASGGASSSTALTLENITVAAVPQLSNLKSVFIYDCDLLKHIFTFSTLENLKQLKWLRVTYCKAIQGLPQLMVFTYGQSKTPRLKYMRTSLGTHSLEYDLNFCGTINQHQDFFIVLHEIFAKRVEVSDIHCVKDAKVPLMMFKFEGISVDLPYAQLQVTTVPENVDILNPLFLNGIDETSWKSLSGVRANNSILQLVPDVKVLA
ncbi:hypothetical protein L1987_06313 [Smallanthus sonchifolius]|uniref:Uncharacterized protein n=1 Tax=Smallanthus sonchifolius TaxID=185202 RepID=A0ACB9JXW2_9ASTR|nr:hypothetical protein L1987_06313 [Smallanthus sonchifolius]